LGQETVLKAMMYAGFGGPDQLHLADIPTPTPEGDQILVRVRASSINSWDWDKLRGPRGLTRLLGPQDTILGCDVSGEVVSCGPEAGDFKAGDRVFGDLSFYGFGAYAEFACASQSAFCAIPEGLDYLQAASLPQGGVLALQGLGGDPSALAGKRVLVVGAGGSVGPFAIQLAHHAGATVSAVDRSDKLPWLESLGVETAIDYQSRDFTALGRIPIDLIIDAVGKTPFRRIYRALAPGGQYTMLGGPLHRIFTGFALSQFARRPDEKSVQILVLRPGRHDLETLARYCAEGTLVAVIDSVFSLEELSKAFERFLSGDFCGKIMIEYGSGLL
jgi:NADPH:quinone reductase-like Zn-dependent oxidoreductase